MEYTVFEILSNFSSKELKQFRRFINSPYFNESRKLITLFERLAEYHPEFPSDKKFIHEMIQSSHEYNQSTVTNLLHDLQCLAERFVIVDAFVKNVPSSASNITKFIRKGGHNKILVKLIKNFENEKKLQGTSGIFSVLDYQDEKFNLMAGAGKFAGRKMFDELEYVVMRRNALNKMYFCIEFVKTWHIYKNVKQKFSAEIPEEEKEPEIENMLGGLLKNEYVREYRELIKIYLDLHRFQKNGLGYFCFKENVKKVIDKLHQDERNYLFGRLIDYTTVQGRLNDEYVKEQMSLYEELFEKEYYKSSVCDYIPPDLWRIVVLYGYRLNDYEWLQSIVTRYSSKLKPELKENLEIYTKAFILYCKKEYSNVLELVHQVEFMLKSFKIDIKSLMLRCYYETGQYETALSLIDSFGHVLNNSNISVPLRRNYRFFIRTVQKMINYRLNPLNKNYKRCEAAYLNIGNVPNKEWLAEKFMYLKSD